MATELTDVEALRRLDTFLEGDGDLDAVDWQEEVERAWLAARKSQLRHVRALLDRGAEDSKVVPIDRAALRTRLLSALSDGSDTQLSLAARGGSAVDIEALIDDLAELEQDRTDEPR